MKFYDQFLGHGIVLRKASLAYVPGLLAAVGILLVAPLSPAQTVTYTDGQTNSTPYSGALILSINSGTATQSGNLDASITKTGAGTLRLSGTNSYGTIAVNGGTLLSTTASGMRPQGDVTVFGSGSLLATSGPLAIGDLGLGSRTLTVDSGRVTAPSVTIGLNASTFSRIILDYYSRMETDSLTVEYGALNVNSRATVSAGSILVSSSNAAINVNSMGTVEVGGVNGLVVTAGLFQFNGGTLRVIHSDLTSSANLKFDNTYGPYGIIDTNGFNASLSGILSGPGQLVKTGVGTLTLTGTNTYAGGTTIEAGTLALGSAAALGSTGGITFEGAGGILQFSSANTTDYSSRFTNYANQAYKVDTNGQAVTFASALTSSGGSLTKSGAGTLTLTAANTYTGGTTVSAGILQIGNGGASGSVTGNITNHGTVAFNRSGDYTFGGVISGTGGLTMNGHVLRLSSAQTYAGPTSIDAGILVLPTLVNQGLAATTTVHVASGTALDLSNRSLTVAGLTGAGHVYSFGGSAGQLTIHTAADAPSTFTGVLGSSAPNFSLTKSGAGTLTLGGANTYTGGTTLEAGSLLVNGSLAAGAVTVNSGATLGGSGTIVGPTTVQAGAHLAPGNSPGQLNFTGDLTLNSGSFTDIELGGLSIGQFDSLSVDINLIYGGTLNLSLVNGYNPQVGDSFQIFKDFNSQSGTFASLSFSNPGMAANFDYSTGTLQFSSVPEPSTWGMLGAALFLLAARWKRRRAY